MVHAPADHAQNGSWQFTAEDISTFENLWNFALVGLRACLSAQMPWWQSLALGRIGRTYRKSDRKLIRLVRLRERLLWALPRAQPIQEVLDRFNQCRYNRERIAKNPEPCCSYFRPSRSCVKISGDLYEDVLWRCSQRRIFVADAFRKIEFENSLPKRQLKIHLHSAIAKKWYTFQNPDRVSNQCFRNSKWKRRK